VTGEPRLGGAGPDPRTIDDDEDLAMSAQPQRISTTRRIAAPADRIFALLTDPRGHVDIDGSGMLVAAPDARPVSAVGDRFGMNMYRESFQDQPLGDYAVENVVTRFEPGSALEWAVAAPGRTPLGHVYGYRLDADGDSTQVTSYCDWSAVPDKWQARMSYPVVPVEDLGRSLDNLQRLLEVPVE
jgi:uncharacterized protein YndB with AHSA1/START domain